MTEVEWLACDDPQVMLRWMCRGKPSKRKLRLFALACCRRVWSILKTRARHRAVTIAERFADRLATQAQREEAQGGHARAVP